MTTALLGAQGLTVGTYTSPNLIRVNERIARNGEPIDDGAFVEVLESLARLEQLMEEPPTRFELLTAAALAWFADEAVDVAVIEVGLGGRWDCTNVVDGERGRAHQHQLRPHRGARSHARGHRPATSRASSRRAAGWSSASPTPPWWPCSARPPTGPGRPRCG